MSNTAPEPARESGGRVWLLDEIRGLSIILMVAYHTAWDIIYIFGVDIPAFHWKILDFAQPFVAGVFIFISGVACRYSRSNLRRGAVALGLGLAMSAFTLLFMPAQAIYFGILHLMGSSMILFALLRRALDRVPPPIGIAVAALLFWSTFRLSRGVAGLPGVWETALPASLRGNMWLLPLGLSGAGADYFPLMPWLFLFLAGSFAGQYFVRGRMPATFYRSHVPALQFVGRHTIYVYVLHQPVVYGVLWVIFWLIRE